MSRRDSPTSQVTPNGAKWWVAKVPVPLPFRVLLLCAC